MTNELDDLTLTLTLTHRGQWHPLDADDLELKAWTLVIGPYNAHINLVGGSGFYGTVHTTQTDTRSVSGPFASAEDTRRWCENTLNNLAATEGHLAR